MLETFQLKWAEFFEIELLYRDKYKPQALEAITERFSVKKEQKPTTVLCAGSNPAT